jgi:hypothetical protein
MNPSQQAPAQPVVFWIIWFAILSGLMIIQFILGGGIPAVSSQEKEPVIWQVVALGAATVALVIRFIIIPRLEGLEKKLPAMIIGLAVSEGVGIIGIFVVPHEHSSTRLFMLGTAIVCIVLSAPVYAKPSGGGSPFRNDPP